jgi:hypothetical protein
MEIQRLGNLKRKEVLRNTFEPPDDSPFEENLEMCRSKNSKDKVVLLVFTEFIDSDEINAYDI